MKLRWRVLTREEELHGDKRNWVNVRINEYDIKPCVLEYRENDPAGLPRDKWHIVEIEKPS